MKRTEKQKRALEELYRVADQAPEDKLHMNAVARRSDCGTARCLLGWMLVDPWFRYNSIMGKCDPNYLDHQFPKGVTLAKMQNLFGLGSRQDVVNLFAGDSNPYWIKDHAISKREVLAAIRTAQRGGKISPYRALRD